MKTSIVIALSLSVASSVYAGEAQPASQSNDKSAAQSPAESASEPEPAKEQNDAKATADVTNQTGSSPGSYTCRHPQNDFTREVKVNYENSESKVPCNVTYSKNSEQPGEVATLWTASNEEGYCEQKAQEFVEKLSGWGWNCGNEASL